jgi:hypothetical protein
MEVTEMPEIIETTVYQLEELSDAAKTKARDWYRDGGFDHDWYDAVYTDFEEICAILGIELETRSVRLMGGGTRSKPCIYFSGFWSQGDGACFEGRYTFGRQASVSIRTHAPQDAELHQIADGLQAIQRRNFYQLRADASHRGRYYHEYCMTVAVERDSPSNQAPSAEAEEVVTTALRDLARWLYRQLEREYEHQTCDDSVDDALTVNGYTFTSIGYRFG